ncbi:MAG: acyl-CoA thioesterase [Flavobacteriaceae bacterium]
MKKGIIEVRVRYAETDQMGVVYHSNYLNFLELGRVEWLRSLGYSYAELEKKGVLLPVVHADLNYRFPARYDELIRVETEVSSIGKSSIEFISQLYNENDTLLLEGKVKLVCLNADTFKPISIPADLRNLIGEVTNV